MDLVEWGSGLCSNSASYIRKLALVMSTNCLLIWYVFAEEINVEVGASKSGRVGQVLSRHNVAARLAGLGVSCLPGIVSR